MNPILLTLIQVVAAAVALILGVAYLTLWERRLVAFIQVRLGPNRVGPAGLLQPFADVIKLLFKEEIVPARADKIVYFLAPLLTLLPPFIVFCVIPFAPDFVIADVDIGVLLVLSVSSLGIFGIILAGWASGSKYSFLGGIRSTAQMISYEISLALSILGVLMMNGTLKLDQIVVNQARMWNILPQFLGFIVFMIASLAETNRHPFDFPECENELVAGYHTEYSSIKFASFFLAEYANMIIACAIAATLYLGGWQGLLLPPIFWFLFKVFLLLTLMIWTRATLPRFRYDQLMRFGWLVLLPLAILNFYGTAIYMVYFAK